MCVPAMQFESLAQTLLNQHYLDLDLIRPEMVWEREKILNGNDRQKKGTKRVVKQEKIFCSVFRLI